jgi:hypothetical protein
MVNRFFDVMDPVDSVHLPALPPLTTLLVRTTNSLYRVVVTEGSNVYVQGGSLFRDPTSAHVDGASIDGGFLMVGRICVGLLMELRTANNHVVTSPVLAIGAERAGRSVVH